MRAGFGHSYSRHQLWPILHGDRRVARVADMCVDPGEPNRVTSQIKILFCLYYKCRPGPGTPQSFNRGLTVGIYINFEAVLLGPADSEINSRQLGL
ncbi:hypothetical protein AVEN_6178-1 [Araneus ventricosus]|uniref:Uncharacterized protein n=1 Tax=Araneus ventricosus TaxID=182803 RepID=A0A4Y2RVY2_ARAVE|nr:hypothetical protein AVEN_6178-1 [Araneus ventricosus]